MDTTDAELDAATDAYVRQRWPDVKEWRRTYPEQWLGTRERIKLALQAADAERIKKLRSFNIGQIEVLPRLITPTAPAPDSTDRK
jgi:hypothetical protein